MQPTSSPRLFAGRPRQGLAPEDGLPIVHRDDPLDGHRNADLVVSRHSIGPISKCTLYRKLMAAASVAASLLANGASASGASC